MRIYRERLTAPPSWWLGSMIFGAMTGWIFLIAASGSAAVVAFVIGSGFASLLVARYGSLLIERTDSGLRVGKAMLEQKAIGPATALDREGYRTQMTTAADARAYLQTRPYLDRGVRVDVNDPADPVPYWLISSRRPEQLAAAINGAQTLRR